MENKLKKLALNFNNLIPDTANMNDLWGKLLSLRNKYRDYFESKDPNFMVNLFLMILSLRKSGNFDFYEKIRDNVFFYGILVTTGDYHVAECEDCSGAGDVICDYCDGVGDVDCRNCDGEGRVICDQCDGEKEVEDGSGDMVVCDKCDGDGEIECDDCEGASRESCRECGGDGRIECQFCTGGEVESETELDFSTFFYLSWTKEAKNFFEMRFNTFDGISDEDLEFYQKDSLLLKSREIWGTPKSEIEEDLNYVYYFDDHLTGNFILRNQLEEKNLDFSFYLKDWSGN